MKLVFGKGINDLKKVNYNIKIYQVWKDMIGRCYSNRILSSNPSYIGCSVCNEWLTFSNFKTWMESQDFDDKQLDKDLLVRGNKLYSPETCVFISRELNCFLREKKNSRGEYLIGVSWHKRNNMFVAQCDGFIGYYANEIEAHETWLKRKLELAIEFSKQQSDPRVAIAIVERYRNYQSVV